MTQKYIQITEDLQYARRQMQNWRQKYTLSQQELDAVSKQNQDLKRTIERLQESNSKLTRTNRLLSEEKQSVVSDLSTEMSTFRQEIAKKQRQISSLKEIVSPTIINQDLALRQMKFELTEQYQNELMQKNRKIEELIAINQKNNYELQIEKQKFQLRIQALQKELRESESKHNMQIQEYSNKLFQQTQVRPPEQRELLKRMKKENQQLKKRLQLVNSNLQEALEDKTKVHKDYSNWMKDHQKQISMHQNQIMTYKQEIARISQILDKTSTKRDEIVIKEREREVKKLKTQLEQFRDQILSKDKRIADLQVEKAKLQGDIRMVKQEQEKAVNRIQTQDHQERQRLHRQLSETRVALQKMRNHNFELNDKILEVNTNAVYNKKRIEEVRNEEDIVRINLKRQLSEQVLDISRANQQNKHISTSNNEQDTKKLEQMLRGQKGKMRDFLAKYIELKKKCQILEGKLKKANQKIMTLLQQKIVYNSPKAVNAKRFQFPTEPQTKISPPKGNNRQSNYHMNSPGSNNPRYSQQGIVINSMEGQQYATTANFKPFRPDAHSKTNPVFDRQFLSPQDNRHIRIQDGSLNSNQNSYYEKSLKMKNRRFKQLKCTNHQQQQCIE